MHTRKKERKHTTQGRDGRTARRHHTGILRRGGCDALAVAHPGESASSYLFSQSLAASRCNLHATSRPSHSRRSLPCHFLLCRVVLFCLVLRRRRLPVPCSRGFFRLSAQLRPPRGVSWPLESIELPSRKDHVSRVKERKRPKNSFFAISWGLELALTPRVATRAR